MHPQISYIIPSHNGESYLSDCVSSILCQKKLSFEIIIVENGSQDKTYALAQKLALQDNRIRVFQSEKGVSNARNVGIENAKGKWLCFVDQDDLLLPNADSVFADGIALFPDCDVYFACADTQETTKENWRLVPKASMQSFLIDCLKRPTQTLSAWAKLFSADFIRKNKLFFDPQLSHSEDSDFVISVLLHCDFVAKIRHAVYHYTINNQSAVHKAGNNLCDKYAGAMLKTSRRLSKAPDEIKSAFLLYVLDHLLIVLVHDVFRKEKGSVKEQFSAARSIFREGVFADALKGAALSEASFAKAVLFFFAKHKILLPLYLAVKVRQFINQNK